MDNKICIGIDIGTISVQMAVLCHKNHLSRVSDCTTDFFTVPRSELSELNDFRMILSEYRRHLGARWRDRPAHR